METSGNLPHAEYRRFESMREYDAVVDALIPQTQRIIRVFDRNLGQAYNSPQRYEALRRFLLASRHNRLVIVLHETDAVRRDCPRMIDLLGQFAHGLSIRQTLKAAKLIYDPFVVFDASHYVHRFHYDHMRAAQGSNDINGTQILIDRFTELFESSAPTISADVSGL